MLHVPATLLLIALLGSGQQDLRALMTRVRPSVVRVTAESGFSTRVGTGVVVEGTGLVVTNHHVVAGANHVTASFVDSTQELQLHLLVDEPRWDLVLLQLDPGAGSFAPLARAQQTPEPGTEVFAIGYPMGLGYTVTKGIVSGLRTFGMLPEEYQRGSTFDPASTWIQTDCPINPGNSGGPLLDEDGRMIGINTWFCPLANDVYFAIGAAHVDQLLALPRREDAAENAFAQLTTPSTEEIRQVQWPGVGSEDGSYLQIDCEPGTDMWIDGMGIGPSPLDGSDVIVVGIPPGSHRVRFVRQLHVAVTDTIDLSKGEVEILRAKPLVAHTGTLLVTTIPVDAILVFDGPAPGIKLKNEPTISLKRLPCGDYRVEALAMSRSLERSFRLPRGVDSSLRFDFVRNEVVLSPDSNESAGQDRLKLRNASKLHAGEVNSIGIEFVRIKPGSFTKGSPASEKGRDSDEGLSDVAIERPYLLSATEVTRGQFEAVLGFDPSIEAGEYDLPVTEVSWYDACEFCERLGAMEQRVYRLPTEDEWEYACRAGTSTRFSSGDTVESLSRFANTEGRRDGFTGVAPVASFESNQWGLFDMHGNVWEWCSSPDRPARFFRGGGYSGEPDDCRSANRGKMTGDHGTETAGFRVVLEP